MTEQRGADHIGALESRHLLLTEETQRAYLEALEDHHPRYLLARGSTPPLAHPGALLDLSNASRSPSFGGPNLAWLHAREEVSFHSPAHLGEALSAAWHVDHHKIRFGHRITQVSCTVTTTDGRRVLSRRSRGLHAVTWDPDAWNLFSAAESATSRDRGGWEIRGRDKSATEERVDLFSGRSTGNLHNDAEIASSAGLSAPVASAAQGMGYLCELMLDNFGERWLEHGRLRLSFHRPLYRGDRLACTGTIGEPSHEDDHVRCEVRLRITNEQGIAVTTGMATARWEHR